MQIVTPPPRPVRPAGGALGTTGGASGAGGSGRGTTLALALAAGLAAAVLAWALVRGQFAPGAEASVPVTIVAAARPIPARTRLRAEMLTVRQTTLAERPAGAVADPKMLIGKVTLLPVASGAAITQTQVSAPTAALGMAFTLPPSQRAVTVTLDPAESMDPFLSPGDRVDVLETDDLGRGSAQVRTILQNVALLAVGAQTDPAAAPPAGASRTDSSGGRVTLAVSPVQAQALVLAGARGRLHLALRGEGDQAQAALPAFPVFPPARQEPSQAHPVLPPPPRVPARPQVRPLPVAPTRLPPPARVTVTIVKGSQSQTIAVEP